MKNFVCNITFVMAHDQESRFRKWMREEAAGVMFLSEMPECNPRLHTVIEAGGEKPGPDHGLSIALQLDFATEEAAHSWHDNALPPVLRDYHQKFGPHALFFHHSFVAGTALMTEYGFQEKKGNGISRDPALDFERIIMGIDPGTNVMGYGVIGINGKQVKVVVMGVIQLSKFESHYRRLSRIFERVTGLVEQYLPDEVAIEAPFFGKNVQSMLKLGRAQGVAMAAVLSRDIPICEYAPLSIKQSVTGNGQASKEQVANMLRHILKIPAENMPKLLDATDALAVALTHFYETGKPKVEKGAKSWEQFLKQNPDRIAPRRK